MLKFISAIFLGLLFLSSCEVELPPRFHEECDVFVNERWNESFRVSNDSINDTFTFVVQGVNSHAFIIAKTQVNPYGFNIFSFTMKPSDSASQLFLLASEDNIACATRVNKGDTLNLNYLEKSGLSESGIDWCNDCEVMLSSQSKPEIFCGPEHFEMFKMPYSIGTGSAASFGWIEFKVGVETLAIVKTNLANRCDETVVL